VGGGTPVTITGENFSPFRVMIMFGTHHAAQVQVVDSQTVTAVTPYFPAGPADVKACNFDDQCGILSGGFSYDEPVFK
jgi:hypothetical protein